MKNYKVYKITGKKEHGSNLGSIEFELDADVEFDGHCYRWDNRISVINCPHWQYLKIGDYIEIDLNYTCTIPSNEIIKYADATKDAPLKAVVVKLESRIRELEGKIENLESSSNNQLVLRRNAETGLISLQTQLTQRDRDVEWGKKELSKFQKKVDELTTQFTDLQIENNRNKDKIKDLKNELGQSRDKYLNQKIELKEEKLEILAQQLGINWGRITNLRDAYRQLIDAQGNNFNPTNINTANGNINNIKTALTNAGVNPTDKKKVCHKCKKITELEIELNQVYQQQNEARQEVPPRNN